MIVRRGFFMIASILVNKRSQQVMITSESRIS